MVNERSEEGKKLDLLFLPVLRSRSVSLMKK